MNRALKIASAGRPLLRGLTSPSSRKRLFAQTLPLVWAMRVGLWTRGFATMRNIAARWSCGKILEPVSTSGASAMQMTTGENVPVEELRELNWAVTRAARMVPQASCLTQALTMQILLGRRGYASRMHIGVAKNESGGFQAHAWVECGGRIVVGGATLGQWTPLTALDLEAL